MAAMTNVGNPRALVSLPSKEERRLKRLANRRQNRIDRLARETPEQKEIRLRKRREWRREQRNVETPELITIQRLAAIKQNRINRLARETPEQKEIRLRMRREWRRKWRKEKRSEKPEQEENRVKCHQFNGPRARKHLKSKAAGTSKTELEDTLLTGDKPTMVKLDHDTTSKYSHVTDESIVKIDHDAKNNVKRTQGSASVVTGTKRAIVRTVTVKRRNGEFGFNVISSAPVIVERVDADGPAKEAGVQVDDIIVGVNGETVVKKDHPYVVNLIRSAQESVTIQLATLSFVTHCIPKL